MAASTASPARTATALLAGWILPGAGHAVLGRLRRGIVFFVLVMGSFGLGLAHDGRLALYSSREWLLSSMQVLANVGVGPADTIARVGVYGEAAYMRKDGDPDPHQEARIETFRSRWRSALSIYGTAYLWTAGLMNLLLLLDVWDLSRGRKD
jgi:hypothetical protein